MSLHFSNDGPEFPNEFIESLLVGEVVFLCGTGVSAPQMPGFRRLVQSTYEVLGVERTGSEQSAFDKGLFEEVLGTLSRRLSDPYAVTRTVSELLTVPDHPSLTQHRTILRLSRQARRPLATTAQDDQLLLEQKILRDHRSHATGATQRRGHDGQVKQGEQEVLHARDSVGQTSGATQRCLNPGCSKRIGNSRRTGSIDELFVNLTMPFRQLLLEYVAYYHHERTHQGRGNRPLCQ